MLLAITGCYHGPGTADPSAPEGSLLPIGVSPAAYTGIFSPGVVWANGCCWIGGEATFSTHVPAGAKSLLVRVAVPDLPIMNAKKQAIVISVNDGPPRTFDHLGIGVKNLEVPFKAFRQAHNVAVKMKMAETLVLPGDGRPLSLFLVKVAAR